MRGILSYHWCVKPLALAFVCCACAHIGQRSDLDAACDAARKERIAGRWDDAIAHLQPALEEARRRGRTDAEARLLVELGQSQAERAMRRGQDSAPALATFERARLVATGLSDRKSLAAAIDGAGMVYYWQTLLSMHNDWDDAMSRFRDALALRDDARDRAASEFHIGLVHQMRGETQDAAQSFARAQKLAEKANDPIELSATLRHQADLAYKQGDLA